jgi:hypothetical protein
MMAMMAPIPVAVAMPTVVVSAPGHHGPRSDVGGSGSDVSRLRRRRRLALSAAKEADAEKAEERETFH